MYSLGIDLHKRSSVWVLIDDEYREVWKQTVPSHPDHISSTIKRLPQSPKEIKVALEPVAGWRFVYDLLQGAGMEVHLANTKKLRLIAESTQKHDHGDARTLAEVLQSGYFPEAHKVSNETYQLRTLLRERSYLIGLRTSAKNRLHGIATTQGLHHIAGGNPLFKRAKKSIVSGDNLALKELHYLIDDLDKRIVPFDAVLREKLSSYSVAQLLMTMPSVGIITALTVVAEVEDFNRFKTPGHLASFAGITPRQRSSGATVRFGSITHQGSKILRTALVETAMRITEKKAPELYAFVERLKSRTGAKKARVALARKLLVIMWHMATKNKPYTPSFHTMKESKLDTGTDA
jgi:transposase